MKKFVEFGFTDQIVSGLHRMNITEPTEIQSQTIPVALNGKDILGSAQTGTGKTFAFGLPLLQKLMTEDHDSSALIVTPTRELAAQVHKSLKDLLGRRSSIDTALLIGGDSIPKQIRQLSKRPQLIVGTPGRINDHLSNNKLKLGNAKYLVLDETDRMLDMGFSVQIEEIAKRMPEKRQTLLFSATLPKGIVHLAQKYLNAPERIAVGQVSDPAANVTQEVMFVKDSDKTTELMYQLNKRKGTIIVFVKTKSKTEVLVKQLKEQGHEAMAMHGDLQHKKRERVLRDYRRKEFRILVATDIAARGLDVPHIEHVISYDLPQLAEDYIHRIGRTARAGASGESVSFVSPADRVKFRNIQKLLHPEATAAELNELFPMPKAKSKASREKMKDKPEGRKREFNKGKRGANRLEAKPTRSRKPADKPKNPNGRKKKSRKVQGFK